jgi:hypothetical protein
MKKYYIKDKIKQGEIKYNIGDEVVVVRRKQNGYPHRLKDDTVYIVKRIENDNLVISQHSLDGVGFLPSIKVHKTYVCNKSDLRDIKINDILN